MSDVVELSIPVRADLLLLARLTAATVASRAEFAIEEVEDLRLAVEELCLSVIGAATTGTTRLRYTRDHDVITIDCSLAPDNDPAAILPLDGSAMVDRSGDLSLRIIEALVDEHGRDTVDGCPTAWIRKRRGTVAP